MKTIRKNLLLLAFATGALFVIGNNVLAGGPTEIIVYPGDGGSGGVYSCYTKLKRPGPQFLRTCRPCELHINVKPDSDAKQRYC